MVGLPPSARRIVAGIAALVAMLVVSVPMAGASPRQAPPPGPLTLNPASGLPGSSFTGSQPISAPSRSLCPDWFFLFDGTVSSGHDNNFTSGTRSASMQVPLNAAAGSHLVESFCTNVDKQTTKVGEATFVVTGATTTTPTTTTTIATDDDHRRNDHDRTHDDGADDHFPDHDTSHHDDASAHDHASAHDDGRNHDGYDDHTRSDHDGCFHDDDRKHHDHRPRRPRARRRGADRPTRR